MNFEYFIANRISKAKDTKSNISSPIVKIAIAAVALSIIMMIVSVSTGIGLQQKIRQKVSAFNGHIVISGYNDNNSDVSDKPISIHQKFYPKFNSVQGIKHIQAIASKAGIIRTEKEFEGIILKGVGKDYDWNNLKEFIIEGRSPHFTSVLNEEIIISETLANKLNLKLNDKFNTFFMKEDGNRLPNIRRFNIVGIYNSGLQEFDSNYIIGDIRHIQKINKWKPYEVGSFEVFVDDFSLIESVGEQVYEETSSTLDSHTIVEKFNYIFDWLKLFDINIIVIICIMIIVSTINMAVALLVLILEKTQMIGILKSLGSTNWSIRKIFLFKAYYIVSKGLFLGNILAVGMLLLQKNFEIIKLSPESYYVTVAPAEINFFYIFLLNFGTVAICILFMLVPSIIISKISPSRVLRFD